MRQVKRSDGVERGGSPLQSWGIVQDERGRILGKMQCPSSMLAADVQIVKAFLIELQKGKLDMAKQNDKQTDKCNMVFLAGVIQSLKVRDDGSAFALVDPGGETKYIPCTVHDSKELARSLGRFEKDDMIQIRGYVRAWSQKKDGEWKNNVEIRITEIKNNPPERARAAARQADDDDIPF